MIGGSYGVEGPFSVARFVTFKEGFYVFLSLGLGPDLQFNDRDGTSQVL